MLPPIWTFTFGLLLLILFGWYFATDIGDRKRNLGTVLAILLLAFCIDAVTPPSKKIRLGLDLQGGTEFLLRLTTENGRPITQGMLDQAVGVIDKRVNKFGVSEPVITPQGADRILVQIPGLDAEKTAEARDQLEKVARLEFKLVYPNSSQKLAEIDAGQSFIPAGYAIQTYKEVRDGKPVISRILVKKKAEMGGEHVTEAHAAYGSEGNEIVFQLDNEGIDEFGRLTGAHIGEQMAIVLDGEVQSAPVIQAAIFQSPRITGNFSDQEAQTLASVLENPLQTPVTIDETRSTSATLGSDSIKSGIVSGIGGLVLVLIFVGIYYRFAGLVAIVGLITNIVLLFGVMSLFNFVLTLPGIAGIILTIGMAVDANVLIYERLREEMALGKSLPVALDAAYSKAFTAIFDANATTLITAAILFWKASGSVKGFAVTLTVGIIASVFSAMVVTRTCFGWALKFGVLKRITMMHFISEKDRDFLGKRFLWITISLTVIAISIAGFAIRGEKNFGIDFKGGDLLTFQATDQNVSDADVRKSLDQVGLGDAVIQKEHDPSVGKDYISIRSPIDTGERIEAQLERSMPGAGLVLTKRDKVGKLVGGEMARNSLIALGLGMLGILIYVTIRFDFSFALGALVALLHDVIITTGVFAICGRELSLVMVGAILTIAGYSINDTIVVYDRIREGLRSGRKGTVQSIMNASINETLSRTILTSGVTLLSVAALFFFGGPVLNDFAFAILIGIVVGTYSSIFIAAPIVLWWSGRKGLGGKSGAPAKSVARSQTAAAS